MKGFNIERFGGVNTTDPRATLRPEEATDLVNVRLTAESISKRLGTTAVGTGLTASQSVRHLDSVRGVLLATQDTTISKLSGSTWTSCGITGISATATPCFIEFPSTASSNTDTGTATSVSDNGYGITDTGKAWTVNAYVDYYLKMTSGSASGQIRLITANTATELFVSEPFDPIPTAANTYAIIAMNSASTYFFNTEQPKVCRDISGTTWAALSNMQFASKYFKGACIYKNRIVGFMDSSSDIYISALRCGESYPYHITVGDGDASVIKGIGVIGDQLVIHKGMENGVWIGQFDDPVNATFTQRAENFGAINHDSIAVGENMMFFVSDRGIECFNGLETNMLEGHKSYSSYRVPSLNIGDTTYNKTTSKAVTYNAKYIATLAHTATPGLTNNRVFIFDTGIYLQRAEQGVPKPYTFLCDKGYPIDSIGVHSGTLYFGGTAKVYSYSGTTDDGSAITAYWEKDGIIVDEEAREKVLRKVIVNSTGGSSTDYVTITITTDYQTKTLSTLYLNKRKVDGKRTRGRIFKIKLDLSNAGTALIENVQLIFEKGTI